MLELKTYKNYKELCEAMDWQVSSGNTKLSQLKELKNVCEYHKNGNKFIIDKIFEIPKPILNKGLFQKDIQTLILHILNKKEDGELFITMKALLRNLSMVNINYVEGYNNKKLISDKFKVDLNIVQDVYDIISRQKRTVERALKGLEKRALISCEEIKLLCINEPEYKKDNEGNLITDINGEFIVIGYNKSFIRPTKEQKQLVLECKQSVMKSIGVKDIRYLFINQDKRRKYYNELKLELGKYNINYDFTSYRIVYIHETINTLLNRSDESVIRDRLNKNVLNSVYKSIENNHNKNTLDDLALEVIEWELYTEEEIKDMFPYWNEIRSCEKYVKHANKVAKKIIDRHVKGRDLVIK